MDAWPRPEVPRLPGRGTVPRVHDTASGGSAGRAVGDPVRLYVCGITPYDATHLGHAATYLAFDLLVRAWRDAGCAVHYVQNVTDVDVPLFDRARETGEDWVALAARETALFGEDMAALRVLPPDAYVAASEAIGDIVRLVERLRERGAAYEVDGDLYFPVSADAGFGALGHLTLPEMLALSAERGGDPDRPGKKDPLDCLLWQAARPGEPAWDSPFGRGRPGWHVECAAIALAHLGAGFDVQGGGSDLVFPHHEMSASEGQAATGETPFARAYVHAGMVGYDGEKMSKSRGNLVFVHRLRADGVDPAALRLALLAHHYRDDWDWTDGDLSRATARLASWRAAVGRSAGPDSGAVLAVVRAALADDLNAPAALAAVDRWVDAALAGTGDSTAAPGEVADLVDALLGVALHD
ncbi:MAG: cysteine--1-D-myo-inosityl 2-amino-2-deoxy-alpha-D-glucopyranoside ligase [Actinomycetes bacterium]